MKKGDFAMSKKTNYRQLYETYQKQYEESKEIMNNRGKRMYEEKYTFYEFTQIYPLMKEYMAEHNPKYRNVNKALVMRQRYEKNLSGTQIEKIREYDFQIKKKKEEQNYKRRLNYLKKKESFKSATEEEQRKMINKIKKPKKVKKLSRQEILENPQLLSDIYWKLRGEGKTVQEAKKYISKEIFGSP